MLFVILGDYLLRQVLLLQQAQVQLAFQDLTADKKSVFYFCVGCALIAELLCNH